MQLVGHDHIDGDVAASSEQIEVGGPEATRIGRVVGHRDHHVCVRRHKIRVQKLPQASVFVHRA